MNIKAIGFAVLVSWAMLACAKKNSSAAAQAPLNKSVVGSWLGHCVDNGVTSNQTVTIFSADGKLRSFDYNYANPGCTGPSEITNRDGYNYVASGSVQSGSLHLEIVDPVEGNTSAEYSASIAGEELTMKCQTIKGANEHSIEACSDRDAESLTRMHSTDISSSN